MKLGLIFALICAAQLTVLRGNSIYLWQYSENNEQSCCLCMSGFDICNPHVACTRNVNVDLKGIYDYITRVLQTEKTATLSIARQLQQAQYYIRHVMKSSVTQLFYKFDEQRPVAFIHDTVEQLKQNEKNVKPAVVGATQDKKKSEELVWQYLVKLGAARPFPK